MGNALGQKVDELLAGVFEGGISSASIGLGKSHYSATNKKLCPFRVAEGVHLTGGIDKIKVDTSTFEGFFAQLFGAAPHLDVELEGLRVRVSADDVSADHNSLTTAQKNATTAQDDLLKYLDNLTVNVRDVVLELCLGGSVLTARVASVVVLPEKSGRGAAKCSVKHSDICLELDGRQLGVLSEANAEVTLAQNFRRADGTSDTTIWADLDVDQLLSLLTLVAVGRAIGGAEARTGQPSVVDIMLSSPMPFSASFKGASFHLNMLGGPSLSAECTHVKVGVSNSSAETRLTDFVVKRTGWAPAASNEVVLQVGHIDRRVSLTHGFSHKGASLPWHSILEMLIDDPRFAKHRVWLEDARNNHGVQVASKKRAREEDGGDSDRLKVLRV